MHFVTGGAFHGKKEWVKKTYLNENSSAFWINGYEDPRKIGCFISEASTEKLIIIEGLEQYIFTMIIDKNEIQICFKNWLNKLVAWEVANPNRTVIIIGTDISKGIVPIEQIQREYRDEVGRCYQLLAKEANKVSLIWYGIQQKLK